MNIEHDLKEMIAKNLPQAVGEALQARLAKADSDAQKVEHLEAALELSREKHRETLVELQKHGAITSREAAAANRETAVAKREHDADLADLRVKLEASEGNTKFARDVALGLVRNVEYKSSVMHNESRSEPIIPAGNTYQAGTANSSSYVTKEVSNTAE